MMEPTTSTTGSAAPGLPDPASSRNPPAAAASDPVAETEGLNPRYRSFSRGSFDTFHPPIEIDLRTFSQSSSRPRKLSDNPLPSPLLSGSGRSSRKNSSDNYLAVSGTSPSSSVPHSLSESRSTPPKTLGSIGIPVLTIRRTSTSAQSSFDHPQAPWEHFRGRLPSQAIDDEPSSPLLPTSRRGSRLSLGKLQLHDNSDSAELPLSCDPETCKHHHHRRSSISSTVSITCSEESDDESDLMGEVTHTINLMPAQFSQLVPLMDRPGEMSELLKHRYNQAWVQAVIYQVGKDVYEKEVLPLWTGTSRDTVSDREWLRKSRDLLIPSGDHNSKTWCTFKNVVGWPGEDKELEEHHGHHARRNSTGDANFPSPPMNAISEEEEEEQETTANM